MKWGMPAMLLAVPCLYVASFITILINDGAPRWLHLVVLLLIWDAMKFAFMGPLSLVLLLRTKATETRDRRAYRRAVIAIGRLPNDSRHWY